MGLKLATEIGIAPQFIREVETWLRRLLPPEWEVILAADDTFADRAAIKAHVPGREATIMVCPTRDVRPGATACHEVVHIVLQRLDDVAERLVSQLPEALRQFAEKTWREALEETVEDLVRNFSQAYGESDGKAG